MHVNFTCDGIMPQGKILEKNAFSTQHTELYSSFYPFYTKKLQRTSYFGTFTEISIHNIVSCMQSKLSLGYK